MVQQRIPDSRDIWVFSGFFFFYNKGETLINRIYKTVYCKMTCKDIKFTKTNTIKQM